MKATTTKAAVPKAPGSQSAPAPGSSAPWAHPVLGRVQRAQGLVQRIDRGRPWLLDTLVVVFVALTSLPDLLVRDGFDPFGGDQESLSIGCTLALEAALIVPLWWRRRAPAVTFALVAAASLTQWVLGVWLQGGLSLLVALYSLALHGSLRLLGWAAAVTAVELSLAVYLLTPIDHRLPGLFLLLGTATAAIALGLIFRTRRGYLAALEDRAARLEVEREQRTRLTAAAERSRVAREMHDIVGHNLAIIVGLADGGATVAAASPERSTEALRIIGDTGRQALGELRRVLGVLRDEPEDVRLTPQPGVADLDTLLGRVRAAGLTVTYRTVGRLDTLGDGVQLTVYRIVQEALTNTLKHAGAGSSATVTLTAEEGQVHVRVADSGPPSGTPAPPPVNGAGHGLVGIRERSGMYGGSVTLGPHGAGWLVDVVIDAPPVAAQAHRAETPEGGRTP